MNDDEIFAYEGIFDQKPKQLLPGVKGSSSKGILDRSHLVSTLEKTRLDDMYKIKLNSTNIINIQDDASSYKAHSPSDVTHKGKP